jgi:hypothetical protein
MYFQPDGLQITATTSKGQLINWAVPSALGLKDDVLLAVARSMLPLPGSLKGKTEKPTTTSSSASDSCQFPDWVHLGLPPHKLSGAARARQGVQIPDSCRSTAKKNPNSRPAGLIAETEGDIVSARQRFTSAVGDGDFSAEIGLGDLAFLSEAAGSGAFEHYAKARAKGVRYAASRLGWLMLAAGADGAAQAKIYFEEASREDDADGFAGLAWINENSGNSSQDLEAAFSNYVRAQYAYERDGALALAQQVAERRAMLARSISSQQIADVFLPSRKSANLLRGTTRQ